MGLTLCDALHCSGKPGTIFRMTAVPFVHGLSESENVNLSFLGFHVSHLRVFEGRMACPGRVGFLE